ncbi:hypothetical protein BN128_3440 [Cronobacter sakazakii 696]|nr:hypothetical protein BN128_3435 [Cronobacter sakazakii 696]CCK09319.1 hypothetical protein BN128_3440 [Cronobacter sakazakii 696]
MMIPGMNRISFLLKGMVMFFFAIQHMMHALYMGVSKKGILL